MPYFVVHGVTNDKMVLDLETGGIHAISNTLPPFTLLSPNQENIIQIMSGEALWKLNPEGQVLPMGKPELDPILIDMKVDKVEGMGLSEEDFSTEEKTKLTGIEDAANNYIHPEAHSATMIDETENLQFVSAEEKVIIAARSALSLLDKPIQIATFEGMDGYILAYNETTGEFYLKADEGGGGGSGISTVSFSVHFINVNTGLTQTLYPIPA